MNKQEQKKYIIDEWRRSSGKRITEMLKRYWKDQGESTYETAKEIFSTKKE